jgi:hypothetical protein
MKTLLFLIMVAVCLTITAHAQLGLTLAQCEAKFGKAVYNHGGIYWDRNGFKMSVEDGEVWAGIVSVSYTSRHPLPFKQLWNENSPGGEFVVVPGFTPWVDRTYSSSPTFHIHSWVSKGMGLQFAEETFAGGWYKLVIEPD